MKKGGAVVTRRGLVLEIQGQQAVVLTPDGDFCRIPMSPEMVVGQEVAFAPPFVSAASTRSAVHGCTRPLRRHARFARQRVWSIFGSVAAVAVIAVGTWMYSGLAHPVTAQAYAWISIDVNPSAALAVSRSMQVVSAKGTDTDGDAMVADLHLAGMSLAQASQAIVRYASAHQQLNQGGAILVSVSLVQPNANVASVQSAAGADVETAIRQSGLPSTQRATEVFTIAVPTSVWQAADSAHISPGRLMSVLVAAQEGHKTGLMDVQGKILGQVWSDPLAQTALKRIQLSDLPSLTAMLQTLADQGFIGKSVAETTRQSGVGTGNRVNSSQTNDIGSRSNDASSATNQLNNASGSQTSNVVNTAPEIGNTVLVGNGSSESNDLANAVAGASKAANASAEGAPSKGLTDKRTASEGTTKAGRTDNSEAGKSAENKSAKNNQPAAGQPQQNRGSSRHANTAAGDENRTSITIHIGNQTFTIPLQSSKRGTGDGGIQETSGGREQGTASSDEQGTTNNSDQGTSNNSDQNWNAPQQATNSSN